MSQKRNIGNEGGGWRVEGGGTGEEEGRGKIEKTQESQFPKEPKRPGCKAWHFGGLLQASKPTDCAQCQHNQLNF